MLSTFYRHLLQAIFCRHLTTIRERDADGSYWFRCVTCDQRWKVLSKASTTKVVNDATH